VRGDEGEGLIENGFHAIALVELLQLAWQIFLRRPLQRQRQQPDEHVNNHELVVGMRRQLTSS
jgi:hypothetical protein